MPQPQDTKKSSGEGKVALNDGKRKTTTPLSKVEEQMRVKQRRTVRKEEILSCKDLRTRGRYSLKTREQAARDHQRADQKPPSLEIGYASATMVLIEEKCSANIPKKKGDTTITCYYPLPGPEQLNGWI